MVTLAEAERETASRVGPFFAMTATGGAADAVYVAGLRSNAPVGGYEGLYLLRREASLDDDRLRTVDRFDGPTGALLVDFPYTGTAAPGEPFELHHLHPDLQLRADVRAALRRCYLLDVLAVTPPPTEPPEPDGLAYPVAEVGSRSPCGAPSGRYNPAPPRRAMRTGGCSTRPRRTGTARSTGAVSRPTGAASAPTGAA